MSNFTATQQARLIMSMWEIFHNADELTIEDTQCIFTALLARYKVPFNEPDGFTGHEGQTTEQYFYDKINSQYVNTLDRFYVIALECLDFSNAVNPNE